MGGIVQRSCIFQERSDPQKPISAKCVFTLDATMRESELTHRQMIGRHLGIGLAIALTIALLFWLQFLHRTGAGWFLFAWLIGINPAAFAYYGFDKWRARNNGARVPEAALLGLALAGGSLGAYAGMEWFRHKTVKGRFRILFWGIVMLQAAIVALVVKESL
jgi:uncharacterized membrane protein YsdA (DUF1294 family)